MLSFQMVAEYGLSGLRSEPCHDYCELPGNYEMLIQYLTLPDMLGLYLFELKGGVAIGNK